MDIKESEPAHSSSAMEINNMMTMTSNDYLNTLFDTTPFQFDNNSNKGFMEMLGLQDFSVAGNSMSDLFPPPMIDPVSVSFVGDQSSEAEVIDKTPANSISNSASSSSDADVTAGNIGEEEVEHPNTPEEDNKSNKQLKVGKRKNEKRKKEGKVAFMTKSEVDHLDDGYRWRKYGQKAVKNSPFPRSYYRCTTAACGVKKRVERSCEDRTIVVTTYEGQHSHPCPLVTRGGAVGLMFLNQCSTATSASVSGVASFLHYNQQQTLFPSYFINNPTFSFPGGIVAANSSAGSTLAQSNKNEGNSNMVMQNMSRAPCLASMQQQEARDDGLLQDIVPSQLRAKQDHHNLERIEE